MRSIKFRVWDSSPEKDGFPGLMIDHDYVMQSDYLKDAINGKYILMQFTGLKDKNGVDIYEGDICLCPEATEPEHEGFYIKHSGFRFVAINVHTARYVDEPIEVAFSDYFERFTEVIGNIHQNSELLNQ